MKRNPATFLRLTFVLLGLTAVYSSSCKSAWAVEGVPVSDTVYSQTEIQSVMNEDEAKIRDYQNQEITQIRIALGRRVPTNRRADLYFRLAEIYLEAYRNEFLFEGRIHEKRIASGQVDKFINRGHSKPLLFAGIKACDDVVKLGIPYEKLDRIYYFLATNYSELDNRAESLKYYDQLTKRFPASPYAAEAFRELGDYAFERSQYAKAQSYYETAIKRIPEESLPRALHKLAWSYYRQKEFERAIETMKEAIAKTGKNGEKYLSVREEALRDMAIFMTESGQVEDALAYFQKLAGDKNYFPKILEKLGKQYERNVQPEKATLVYEMLLKTHPEDESAFRVLVKLIDLDLRRGKYPEALERLKTKKLLTTGDPETQSAVQNLRSMVRRAAVENHDLYRRNASKQALAVAEDYYTAYLEFMLSKSDPATETPEIEMYLAEVKRENSKAKEASALYRKVLESGDKRYAKEAGSLWVASLSEAIRKSNAASRENSPKEGAQKEVAIEPSALEHEYIEAADEMQTNLGELPEGHEAALRSAQVLAGYKKSQPEAIERIKKIISSWPTSPQAWTAARLWLQLLSDRLPVVSSDKPEDTKAFEELRTVVKEIHANTAIMKTDEKTGGNKIKTQLADLDIRLKIGLIASFEREKDYGSAAKGYETFAADTNKRDVAERALANAITSYLKAGDLASVERLTGIWLKRYPDSKQTHEAVRSAATVALIQGQFEAAAQIFEKLSQGGSVGGGGGIGAGVGAGDPDSLKLAGRIFEAAGNGTKARTSWKSFLNLYPKSPHRWNVALSLAGSLHAQGQSEEAAKIYKLCLPGPPEYQAECGTRLADLYIVFKERDQAKALYKRIASMTGKEISPYVGYARYRLGELMEGDARFEVLQLPEAKLKKALKQREDFLEPLSRAYLSAVEVGGPWGIAALDRLATWALNFATDLDNINPPEKATPEGVGQFRKNLSAISDPLRLKAIETWNNAYQKANSAEILSPVLPTIADRLADARMVTQSTNYPFRAQGFRGKFRLAGMPADGGPENRDGGRDAAMKRTRERLMKDSSDAAAWVDYGNLLWGESKPLLAKIAYDRSVSLNQNNPAALNNRAVVTLSGSSEEDWYRTWEGSLLLNEALGKDSLFLAAKMNKAILLNYYRVFKHARPLWEQVNNRSPSADGYDGLAISCQGMGDSSAADQAFIRADSEGSNPKRFAKIFHEAAKAAYNGSIGAAKCFTVLSEIDEATLTGFEKQSLDSLKRNCKVWKTE